MFLAQLTRKPEKAYKLYSKKFSSRILAGGGLSKISGKNESENITESLVNLGVKKEYIILENKSSNTF